MQDFNVVAFLKTEGLAKAKKKEIQNGKHEGIEKLEVKIWQKDGLWVVSQKVEYTKEYQKELDNLFL
jgi:hypothetical protein